MLVGVDPSGWADVWGAVSHADVPAAGVEVAVVARQTMWQGELVAEAAPLLKGLNHHESSPDDPGGEEAPHCVVRVAG